MRLLAFLKRRIQKCLWDYFWRSHQLPQISIGSIASSATQHIPRVMDEICMPPYLGNPDFEDYSCLISIVKAFRPTLILELGTAHGNTVANICSESEARVITINALPDQLAGSLTTYTLEKGDIGYVYRKYGFGDRVFQIYESTRSIQIRKWVAQGTVELAIIDACHDPDFVVSDFLAILPAISSHGHVILHDTHPSLTGYTIDSYVGCMYLRMLGFNINHISGSSWAIWSAKESRIQDSLLRQMANRGHTIAGWMLFGDRDHFIRALRWMASGFMRGRFEARVTT